MAIRESQTELAKETTISPLFRREPGLVPAKGERVLDEVSPPDVLSELQQNIKELEELNARLDFSIGEVCGLIKKA